MEEENLNIIKIRRLFKHESRPRNVNNIFVLVSAKILDEIG